MIRSRAIYHYCHRRASSSSSSHLTHLPKSPPHPPLLTHHHHSPSFSPSQQQPQQQQFHDYSSSSSIHDNNNNDDNNNEASTTTTTPPPPPKVKLKKKVHIPMGILSAFDHNNNNSNSNNKRTTITTIDASSPPLPSPSHSTRMGTKQQSQQQVHQLHQLPPLSMTAQFSKIYKKRSHHNHNTHSDYYYSKQHDEALHRFDRIMSRVQEQVQKISLEQLNTIVQQVLLPSYRRLYMEATQAQSQSSSQSSSSSSSSLNSSSSSSQVLLSLECYYRLMDIVRTCVMTGSVLNKTVNSMLGGGGGGGADDHIDDNDNNDDALDNDNDNEQVQELLDMDQLVQFYESLLSLCRLIVPHLHLRVNSQSLSQSQLSQSSSQSSQSLSQSQSQLSTTTMIIMEPNSFKILLNVSKCLRMGLAVLYAKRDVRAQSLCDTVYDLFVTRFHSLVPPPYMEMFHIYTLTSVVNNGTSGGSSGGDVMNRGSKARELYLNGIRPHMNSILVTIGIMSRREGRRETAAPATASAPVEAEGVGGVVGVGGVASDDNTGDHEYHDPVTCPHCQYLNTLNRVSSRYRRTYAMLANGFAVGNESMVDIILSDVKRCVNWKRSKVDQSGSRSTGGTGGTGSTSGSSRNRRSDEPIGMVVLEWYLSSVARRAKSKIQVDKCVKKAMLFVHPHSLSRVAYNNVLYAYSRVHQPLEVKAVFESMCQKPNAQQLIAADTANIVLTSCKVKTIGGGSSYDSELVSFYLTQLNRFAIQPDKQLYTTLLNILSCVGDIAQVKNLLQRIQAEEFHIDSMMLATIMRNFLASRHHTLEDKFNYLKGLRAYGRSSVDLYNIILKSIMQDQQNYSVEQNRKACETLLDMMVEDNIQPDDYTINALLQILKHIIKEQNTSPDIGRMVLGLTKQSLISPNPPSLDTMTSLVSFFQASNQIPHALEVSKMLRRRYKLDSVAYTTLIHLHKSRDLASLIELFREILDVQSMDQVLFDVFAKTVLDALARNRGDARRKELLVIADRLFTKTCQSFFREKMKLNHVPEVIEAIRQSDSPDYALAKQLLHLLE